MRATYEDGKIVLGQSLALANGSQLRVTLESVGTRSETATNEPDFRTVPEARKRLFIEVFRGKTPRSIAETAAAGIQAVMDNVELKLGDLRLLLAGGRFATASFLLATADEEMAKVFILIDACRLDPQRHAMELRRLCGAFYDHRLKYAYNCMRRFPPVFNGMRKGWDMFRQRWWPESADPESGEPAMPHDTYFSREMPLYVDWDYCTKTWALPDNTTYALKFSADWTDRPVDVLEREIKELRIAGDCKLLCAEALMCVNEVWGGLRVREGTPASDLERAENRLVQRLTEKFGVPEAYVRGSPLLRRPLYYLIT